MELALFVAMLSYEWKTLEWIILLIFAFHFVFRLFQGYLQRTDNPSAADFHDKAGKAMTSLSDCEKKRSVRSCVYDTFLNQRQLVSKCLRRLSVHFRVCCFQRYFSVNKKTALKKGNMILANHNCTLQEMHFKIEPITNGRLSLFFFHLDNLITGFDLSWCRVESCRLVMFWCSLIL